MTIILASALALHETTPRQDKTCRTNWKEATPQLELNLRSFFSVAVSKTEEFRPLTTQECWERNYLLHGHGRQQTRHKIQKLAPLLFVC